MKKKSSKNGDSATAGTTGKAFVISQIGEEKSPIRGRADEVLDFIISPVAGDFKLEVIRSDRDPTPGHLTSRLIKQILDARVIIADLTGRNANAYYELGVVHSFRASVVILVDHVDALSFDVEHERVIEIGDDGTITARQADLAKKRLQEALSVVLKSGYKPSSLVTEVAEAQSLAKLAPHDPVASEVATIKQRIDELAALVRSLVPTPAPFTLGQGYGPVFRAGAPVFSSIPSIPSSLFSPGGVTITAGGPEDVYSGLHIPAQPTEPSKVRPTPRPTTNAKPKPTTGRRDEVKAKQDS